MPYTIRIDSSLDPRLAPFRDLKDRRIARAQGLFIVEGLHLVRRLLVSSYDVQAVVCSERRSAQVAPLL
ncbi:RNA methyltransferase, partial [candidate division KSB1 bacterium]|nr:RNA methyltransferase [candidate division KSB1 bacterium]